MEVVHLPGARPVDSAKAFLDARFQAAMDAQKALASYISAVANRDQPPIDISWIAIISLNATTEREAPVLEVLSRFADSPEGAAMSDADRDFLKRHVESSLVALTNFRRQNDEWASKLTFPRGMTLLDVRRAAGGVLPAWIALGRLNDGVYERLLQRVEERIGDPAEILKWKRALVGLSGERPSFPSRDEYILRHRAAETAIEDVFKDTPEVSTLWSVQKGFMGELLSEAIIAPSRVNVSLLLRNSRIEEVIPQGEINFIPLKLNEVARRLWLSSLQ